MNYIQRLSKILLVSLVALTGLLSLAPTTHAGGPPNLLIEGPSSVTVGDNVTIQLYLDTTTDSVDVIKYDIGFTGFGGYQTGSDASSAFPAVFQPLTCSTSDCTETRFHAGSDISGHQLYVRSLTFTTTQTGQIVIKGAGDATANQSADSNGNTYNNSVSALSITVNPKPTPPPAPAAPTIDQFTVSPNSITKGSAATLHWQVSNASSVKINNGVGDVPASGQQQVKPSGTTTYTLTATSAGGTKTADVKITVTNPPPAATVTPKPTPRPTTPKPTTAATATPAPSATVDPNAISAELSTVNYSSTTAVADGVSTITACVTVRNNNGDVVTDVTPAITGLRANDVASPFVQNDVDNCWESQLTSTQVGLVTVTVAANDVTLNTTDLTYTEASPSAVPVTVQKSGPSLLSIIAILGGLLLLILLLLFFIRRKQRNDDDQDPGSGTGGEPIIPDEPTGETPTPAPAETPQQPETQQQPQQPAPPPPVVPPAEGEQNQAVRFDPNQVLQRADNAGNSSQGGIQI